MRVALLLIGIGWGTALSAQEITEPAVLPGQDSVREQYIRRFSEHFFLYPVLKQRSLTFGLEKQDADHLLAFRPNNAFSFGVGTYLFELGLEFTFAIPLNEKSKFRYGESDTRDLRLNILGKKFGLDAFFQRYTGFYIDDVDNRPPSGMPFPQRPDITSRNFGVTGNYVFSNEKFSFRSTYNFSEQQLFSRGSFLVFAAINSFRLVADSTILPGPQKNIFGENVSFTRLRATTFSVAPGYTYNLIYKDFFLSGTLSVGPAHHWVYYRLENGTQRNDISINTFAVFRVALGYNGERIFGGISFVTQESVVPFEDVDFSSQTNSFKILVGYRFQEFGILKKRVWDIIPLTL